MKTFRKKFKKILFIIIETLIIKYTTARNNPETQFYEVNACVNSVVLVLLIVMIITVATDNFLKEINPQETF